MPIEVAHLSDANIQFKFFRMIFRPVFAFLLVR